MPSLRSSALLSAGLLLAFAPAALRAQTPETTPPAAPAPPPVTTSAVPAASPARSIQSSASGMVGPIKFGDITTDGALDMLERWSGRTVLRPKDLPAVSLAFSLNQKMSKEDAQSALESVLTLNGIAVTPLGDRFLKVTPLATARSEAPDFIEGSTLTLTPSGHIASKIFQLQFLRISEFMPQISGILNAANASPPLLFEKANAALVTDSVSNLQRIETLINRLDQPALSGLSPKFFKVQNTTASELVTKLQSLLNGPSGSQLGTGTIFQADDRTNQIIVLSDSRQHAFFEELITKLDVGGESSMRQEVIPLKHAKATDVGSLLTQLVTGQMTAARTANQTNQNQANARNNANAAANLNNRNNAPPLPGNNNNNASQAAAQQAAQAAARQAIVNQFALSNGVVLPGSAGAASVLQQFSTILTIVPDDRSNSLVVSGTVDDMRLIKDLISHLDVLLAQVRIEVVIAEVTLTDAASTGIESLGLTVAADKLVGFSGNPLPGVTVTNGTVTLNAAGGRDLAATLNLSTSPRKSNTNILSVPNIVTTHNKEATIFVGEQRPTISSYQNTGTNTGNVGTGYTSNVTQQKIGITLTVTPLIGNDGSVQLDIKQEVNDILGEVILDGNSQPVVGSRTMDSFVTVGSGEIVVLGGLQRKSYTRATSRFAGIPILGDLLGRRTKQDTRTDLVFFLRPYVLTNTAADNDEAMGRLKKSPQHDDVLSALKGDLPVKK